MTPSSAPLQFQEELEATENLGKQIFPQTAIKGFQVALGDSCIQNFSTETFSVAKKRSCSVSLCIKFLIAGRGMEHSF